MRASEREREEACKTREKRHLTKVISFTKSNALKHTYSSCLKCLFHLDCLCLLFSMYTTTLNSILFLAHYGFFAIVCVRVWYLYDVWYPFFDFLLNLVFYFSHSLWFALFSANMSSLLPVLNWFLSSSSSSHRKEPFDFIVLYIESLRSK